MRTDAFIDPVLQEGFVRTPVLFDADWVIEIGFKPGVTDNVGRTAREVIEAAAGYTFGEEEGVYTSKMYFIKGPSPGTTSVRVAEGILANTLINRYAVKHIDDYRKDGGMGATVPKVTTGHEPVVESFDLDRGHRRSS